MKIYKASFVKGIIKGKQKWDPSIRQVAFYGRSNVGKSSTINTLLENKSLTKTSSVPGKTSEINLFNVNDNLFFLDLPGYGYAKTSGQKRAALRKLILWYIMEVKVHNRTHVMVLDSKVGLTDNDNEFLEFLNRTGEQIIIVFNKIDKLNQKEYLKKILGIKEELVGQEISLVPFSAKMKKGVNDFWEALN